MLQWSRRSIQRTTRAAARCTISSRCSRVPVIPNYGAFPKSSVEPVTSTCTSVLHALSAEMIYAPLYFVIDRILCRIYRVYVSDVCGHRHCGVKIHANVTDVSVSASYCIPQCVRLIAAVCTHYVVYNISKKKNTVHTR